MGKVVLVIALAILSLLTYTCGAGSATAQAEQVLRADGVRNIVMTGYEWLACSKDDTFHNGFQGVKNGVPVKGVVCSGYLKGATIRYTRVGQ